MGNVGLTLTVPNSGEQSGGLNFLPDSDFNVILKKVGCTP